MTAQGEARGGAQSGWRQRPDGQPHELLVVEDNLPDVELTRRCLKQLGIPVNLRHVETAEDALAYLRRQGGYAAAARPDLILLDLNLPGMSGLELLIEIRCDPALVALSVVMFTTSNNPHDLYRCLSHGCSSYVVKPRNYEDMVDVMHRMLDYWLNVASLPPPPPPSHGK